MLKGNYYLLRKMSGVMLDFTNIIKIKYKKKKNIKKNKFNDNINILVVFSGMGGLKFSL